MKGASVVYPRFLGVDENGDNVWELASGRWTWGDDPYQAAHRARTWAPDRYVDKYGAPQPLAGQGSPVQAEAEPVLVSQDALRAAVAEAFEDGKKRGAEAAESTDRKALISTVLYAMNVTLDDWIGGARENHDAMDHRGEGRGEECWRRFHPADVRNMINDVAREMGVGEFPAPEVAKEDAV